ncbi:hypothetical protein J6590_071688 [Homalodisca vitripennis]|nr:hypothetical protein J6590_071688 [Homalodisca vitripennis]
MYKCKDECPPHGGIESSESKSLKAALRLYKSTIMHYSANETQSSPNRESPSKSMNASDRLNAHGK